MGQESKNNSRTVGCQKRGEGRGSLLVVKLQHHQFTNPQPMGQPLRRLQQRSQAQAAPLLSAAGPATHRRYSLLGQ